MSRCHYTTETGSWTCPLQALPHERYCYWHKKEDGKKVKKDKFQELAKIEQPLYNAYLRKANLAGIELTKDNIKTTISLISADLREANVSKALLQDLTLKRSDLRGSNFGKSKLKNVTLSNSDLSGANFTESILEEVNLSQSSLKSTDFSNATFINVDLSYTNLTGANLFNVYVDKNTNFTSADLTLANLYHSYIDETKSLRNARIFDKVDKDINELVGDYLFHNNILVLDVKRIEEIGEVGKKISMRLHQKGLVRYIMDGRPIIFYDKKRRKVLAFPEENKENSRDRLYEDDKLHEDISHLVKEDYKSVIYSGKKKELYMAAYEVYNSLYSYYLSNGKLDEAFHVHYRRNEVKRKISYEEGGIHKIRAWLFDYLILKLLTGYGVKLERPFIAFGILIFIYSLLFKVTNSIVKISNGKIMYPTFWDYLYYSIATFTGIGSTNFQPAPNMERIFYILVSTESILGLLVLSLIIFVITYRVSK